MTQLGLLDQLVRQDRPRTREMADTSLAVYQERILPTLQAREVLVFRVLCEYLRAIGAEDATGGELTAFAMTEGVARDVNGVRPRLTGLHRKGWIERRPARKCRAYGAKAHPYRPVVPLAALERMQRQTEGNS